MILESNICVHIVPNELLLYFPPDMTAHNERGKGNLKTHVAILSSATKEIIIEMIGGYMY